MKSIRSSSSPAPASSSSPDAQAAAAKSPSSSTGANTGGGVDLRERPMHDEIAACARELWRKYGCPSGRDEAIWLEAERQLLGVDREIARGEQPMAANNLHESGPSDRDTSTPGGQRRPRGAREGELAGAGAGGGPRRR